MTKFLLPALAGTALALSISATAQASLSLGPPQSVGLTKAAVAPALRTARFTRLPVARSRALRRPRNLAQARDGC